MVISRLEPELKTRLSRANIRNTAPLKKKMNYSQIRSRLFTYGKRNFKHNSDYEENYKNTHIDHLKPKDARFQETHVQSNDVTISENEIVGGFRIIKASRSDLKRIARHAFSVKRNTAKQPSLRYIQPKQHVYMNMADADLRQTQQVAGSKRSGGDMNNVLLQVPQSEFVTTEIASTTGEKSQIASVELESMFDKIITRKCGSAISPNSLFGAIQEKSIIPRLRLDSPIFRASPMEIRRLHEALNIDRCAGKFHQHDCLNFVYTRD